MNETRPRRALVVGLAASGVAATALLVRNGYSVCGTDLRSADDLGARLGELPAGVELVLGGHSIGTLDDTALVVVSPGVPWQSPLLAEARRRGIEVIAEVELAYRSLATVPLAAVTGSNGKSTVTALLGEILRMAGLAVAVGGNIGHPASSIALRGGCEAWVLELSSFQLEGCTTLRPRVAALLNLSADHLDRHGSLDTYLALKARLFANQEASDHAVLNADDPALAALAVPSTVDRFSLTDTSAAGHLAGDTLVLDGRPLIRRADLPLPGDHNAANALAAALAATRMGAPREAVATALHGFAGLPHRHQVVVESGGVRWVDDSKGTNIGATVAGLTGYPAGTIHLILGGLGKGQELAALRPAVEGHVARAYLIGAAAEELAAALAGAVPLERCDTLEEAVRRAARHARAGDTVLLSPACASFDQFADYAARGDEFARLARAAAGGT